MYAYVYVYVYKEGPSFHWALSDPLLTVLTGTFFAHSSSRDQQNTELKLTAKNSASIFLLTRMYVRVHVMLLKLPNIREKTRVVGIENAIY